MRLAGILVAAALAAPGAAGAQSIPDLLPQVGDPTEARAADLAAPEDRSAPVPLGPEAVAGGPAFPLGGVELVGATAIPEAALAPLWADLIGTPVDLAALEAIAAAIEARYRAEGYVLSQAVVPAQTVEGGVVTIRVVEGFVDRIALEGGTAPAAAWAARRFEPVAAERPLDIETLERSVLIARDTLGGTVETVLEPSPATFGGADLTVLVAPRPFEGFAAADNRGSRLFGDVSATLGASAYGLLGLNERLDLLVAGDPGGTVGFGSGRVTLPLAALDATPLDGARLEVFGEIADSDPDLSKSGSPDTLEVALDEVRAGAVVVVPAIRTRRQNLFARVGLDWRRSKNATFFGGVETTETDELIVLEAAVSWDRADRFGGVTLVDALLRQGLDVGPAEIGTVGPGAASADFTRAELRLARIQQLGTGPWSLYGEAIGQLAGTILPDVERFALGEATIGRGFQPGNTTGDSGWGGRLEVRRQVPGAAFGAPAAAAELYAFTDYGEAYDRAGERDGNQWEPIGSVGIGARIDVADWLTLTPAVVRQTAGRAVDTTDRQLETRVYLGAVARF